MEKEIYFDYDIYGIYELREIGRLKGIKSPTKYRKKDLMEAIIKIDKGERLPEEKSKQGRPPSKITIEKLKKYECNDCPVLKNFKLILDELIIF